ncbi:MAG: penicillin-binding protein 2 [Actinobacteria bacterium]|nr:penicillin-binding protein 2 [Actinomycetota bacterium]
MSVRKSKQKSYDWQRDFEKRLSISIWAFVIVFAILVLRLWFLQVIYNDYYTKLAEENRLKIEETPALRGKILDRNGRVLAKNRFSFAIFVDRKKLNDKELFSRLAEVLETTPGSLMRKANKSSFFLGNRVLVERDVPFEKVSYLKERKEEFKGLTIDYLSLRYYPNSNLASHVIGYVGEVSEEELKEPEMKGVSKGDIVGKTGIEKAYDTFLRGVKGKRIYEVDALGNIRRVVAEEPAVSGKDVYLTLDAEIQKQSEEAIRKAIERAKKLGFTNANSGAALVMEVNTGKIVAMASFPDYNPNLFVIGLDPKIWKQLTSAKSGFPLLNRTTKTGYAPGSTFKVVTLISAFENDKTFPGEGFYCAGKWFGFGKDWPKSCWKKSGHGHIGLIRSITESCDVVFYELGYRLYKTKGEPLQNTARKLNFGRKTGIEIGESEGRVPDKAWKKRYFKKRENQIWLPGDTVNMAIGQGDLLATPLQIARLYAAIANGGKFYKPLLVEKVVDSRGKVIREGSPELDYEVRIGKNALRIIKQGLAGVTSEGTARTAFSGFPVKVAGKTGTSQVYGKDDFSLFVGYAPYDNPKYVVCVVIEQGGHGGEVAAPAARFIFSALFGVGETDLVKAVDVSR